jgi:CDGSH-type Zn-finger protein
MPPDRPFRAQVTAGELIVWCACGRSQRQPYCDGSHRGTEFRPMRYTVPQNLTVAFCGCKQTKQPPFCDGSHLAFRAQHQTTESTRRAEGRLGNNNSATTTGVHQWQQTDHDDPATRGQRPRRLSKP